MTDVPPIADFARCDADLLAELGTYGPALVSDAMERFGSLVGEIAAQWPTAAVAGNAFTVWTREGDNLGIHQALDVAAPGDVLMVNGNGCVHRALIGEMIGIKAKARGIAGFVIDGAVRDITALRSMGMPVFARVAVPAGPFKYGPYRLLQNTAVGGVSVAPGDAVLADRDGVTVVARADVAAVVARARQIAADERFKRLANVRPIR